MALKTEMETTTQALYEAQREIRILKELEVEYQDDIKLLQSEKHECEEKLLSKIQQMEEAKFTLELHDVEQISNFEKILAEKDDEIEILKNELDLVNRVNAKFEEESEVEKLVAENAKVHETNNILSARIDFFSMTCEQQEDQINQLKETVTVGYFVNLNSIFILLMFLLIEPAR